VRRVLRTERRGQGPWRGGVMTEPVWLLDIDGVVNAYGGRAKLPTHAWPEADWIVAKANGFHIWAARPVLEFIRETHESGAAEIRWHTTWQHDAQLLADALELPTFRVQPAPEFHSYTQRAVGWWKLPAAERVLMEEERRLVWTDDDATWSLHGGKEAALRQLGDVLVVAPSEQTGLCKSHLRLIREFLSGGSDD
jgi:hypothetical protein